MLSPEWMSVPWRTGIEDLLASFPAAVRPWIKGYPWTLIVGSKGRTRLEHSAQTGYPPLHIWRRPQRHRPHSYADECVGHALWMGCLIRLDSNTYIYWAFGFADGVKTLAGGQSRNHSLSLVLFHKGDSQGTWRDTRNPHSVTTQRELVLRLVFFR